MRKLFFAALVFLTVCINAGAESVSDKLEKGHAALREGDTSGAMTMYRDLQVDEPESELLYYNIGCAQYKDGEAETSLESPPDSVIDVYFQAKESFAKVLTGSDERVRVNAGYNYANCMAQIAKETVKLQDHEKSISAFEESVSAYEEFLRRHPDHSGAKNNLDHMRYYLKSLMQNPPEQQEQQQQQGDENKEQEKQEPEGEQQQKPEEGDEEKQEGGGEQEPQEQQGDEQQQQQEQSEMNQGDGEPDEQERQNIEAILQSLEDIDNQEQKETRSQRSEIGVSRNWW